MELYAAEVRRIIREQDAQAVATLLEQLAQVTQDSNSRRAVMEEQATRLNEYVQQLETVTRERDEAIKVRTGYDKWLQGGVYFTNEEFDAHEANHRQQLATAQARITRLREVMEEVGGMAGKDWLAGQLKLAQALAQE